MSDDIVVTGEPVSGESNVIVNPVVDVTAESVRPLVVGAVSGEELDALKQHIAESVAGDPESMLQVHAELTGALTAAGHIAPVAANYTPVNAAAEIHEHLNDMERTIADFGSAGGNVLAAMIDLIRSKL
jgi:hypothetical protein